MQMQTQMQTQMHAQRHPASTPSLVSTAPSSPAIAAKKLTSRCNLPLLPLLPTLDDLPSKPGHEQPQQLLQQQKPQLADAAAIPSAASASLLQREKIQAVRWIAESSVQEQMQPHTQPPKMNMQPARTESTSTGHGNSGEASSTLQMPAPPAATAAAATVTEHYALGMPLDENDEAFADELDKWTGMMRKAILADFQLSRNKSAKQHQIELDNISKGHASALVDIQGQFSEKKLLDHSKLVNAVTIFLTRKRRKLAAGKWFALWRIKYVESRREKLATRMARHHAARTSVRKALLGWYRVAGASWHKAMEKKIRVEAERHMQMLSVEYEQRIADLTSQLNRVSLQLQESQQDQMRQKEDMKRSFLRGVCALNMEAMSMFRNGSEAQEDYRDAMNQPRVHAKMEQFGHPGVPGSNAPVSFTKQMQNLQQQPHPQEQGGTVRFAESSHPAVSAVTSRTNGLVTRHYT
ncbi:hypothetical protein BC831DRAFT_442890 [Entophlyctis helioformis]|nr:hypothetical protein BC831DRAFT_442890 [Entophlyctis helioformis]